MAATAHKKQESVLIFLFENRCGLKSYLPGIDIFSLGMSGACGCVAVQHVVQGLGHAVNSGVDTEGSALHQFCFHDAQVCRRKAPAAWTWVLQRGDVRRWWCDLHLQPFLLHLGEKLLYVRAEQIDGLGHVSETQHSANSLNARQADDAVVYSPRCAC